MCSLAGVEAALAGSAQTSWAQLPEAGDAMPAAVLVALVPRAGGVQVLLTLRAPDLAHHGGQIGFPGGRKEAQDVSPLATALREAQEEIGLPPECVEALGILPRYYTSTGFVVTPVLAWAQPPEQLTIDRAEVSEVFELPFSCLGASFNYRCKTIWYCGCYRSYYSVLCQGREVWGVTAGILHALACRLEKALNQSDA